MHGIVHLSPPSFPNLLVCTYFDHHCLSLCLPQSKASFLISILDTLPIALETNSINYPISRLFKVSCHSLPANTSILIIMSG